MGGNTTIVDGATNETAKVDSSRRLHTRATTFSNGLNAAINGDEYIAASPLITLTVDSESAVMFIQNSEPDNISWAVTGVSVTGGSSVGGVGEWFINFYVNDTGGTILTSGSDLVPIPLNLGVVKALSGVFKSGADGLSFDGDPVTFRLESGAPSRTSIPLDALIVPPGSSVGISIIPPSGNTDMSVDLGTTIIRLTGE